MGSGLRKHAGQGGSLAVAFLPRNALTIENLVLYLWELQSYGKHAVKRDGAELKDKDGKPWSENALR